MTLSRFVRYFKRRTKRKILNLLSLEFSDTSFSAQVGRPKIVDQIDHVTQCWPVSKRSKPTGETDLEWPKVQKYCLMSPAGAYTDFHIDFGGTSVWYHVHKQYSLLYCRAPIKNAAFPFL